MLGEWKEKDFNTHMEFLHFRDDSMTVPRREVDATIFAFQTIFFITAFCSTCIIRDGLSRMLFFFKGSLLYTSYNVLQVEK